MSAFLFAALLAAEVAAPPRFDAETDTVRLDVVALRDGEPLRGLQAADFEVIDNGVRQPAHLVSRAEQGLHAVLVLDVSSSVRGRRLDQLKAATLAFLDGLADGDRATLVTFSDQVRLAGPPGDLARIRQAVPTLEAAGSTALFDALYAALKLTSEAPGRPLVLVFSDGCDQLSWLKKDALSRVALDTDAAVYFVRAGQVVPGEDPQGSVPALEAIAHSTGGQHLTAERGLETAFLHVLGEAKSRYLLAYEPAGPSRPGWHEVKVRLRNRKGQVRARRGYYAP